MPRKPPTTGPYVQDEDSDEDEFLLTNFVPSDDYDQEVVQTPQSPQSPSWCECDGPCWIASTFCTNLSSAIKIVVTSLNRVIMLRPAVLAVVALLFGLSVVASRQLLHSDRFFIPNEAPETLAPTKQPIAQPIRHPAAWWKEQLEAQQRPAPAPRQPISKPSPQPSPPSLSPTPHVPVQLDGHEPSLRDSHRAKEGEAAWWNLSPLQQQEVIRQAQRNSQNGAIEAAAAKEHSSSPNHFSHLACSNWSTSLTSAIRHTPCNLASPRNIILVHEKEGSHGTSLFDLTKALNETLKYASRLCARVLFPPPFMALSSHQNRRPVNCSWQWSRYWEWDKLSPVVSNWKDVLPLALGAKDDSSDAHCSGSEVDDRSLAVAKIADLEALHHLALNSGRMSAPSIPAMFQLFLEGKPFVHTMDTQALVPRNKPCNLSDMNAFNYVPGFPSNLAIVKHARIIERVADGILHDIQEKTMLLLTIHDVDATNASDGCDSYLTRLHMYLNCTIGDYNGTFPLILFATDEIDAVNRDEILRILRDFSLRALNIEPLAMGRLQAEGYDTFGDHVVLYAVMGALQTAADGKGNVEKAYSATFGGKNSFSNEGPLEDCEQRMKCEHGKKIADATNNQLENATAGGNATTRRIYTRLRWR